MSNKNAHDEAPFDTLKNESARQRWQLFHRAIAHAKQSNSEALLEADRPEHDGEKAADASPEPVRNESQLWVAR